jgi:hypothetical protein
MAAITKANSQLADSSDNPLIGLRQSNVADAAAATAGALAIAYATDDPGVTVDGTINIADGDAALVVLEVLTAIEELVAEHNLLLADVALMRTALNSALDVLEEHGLMTAS